MNGFKSALLLKRVQFFEIEDLPYCPTHLRNGVTDFLQHIVQVLSLYRPIAKRLQMALKISKQKQILDLCSGGTGPWLSLSKEIKNEDHTSLRILLTDLYPNQQALYHVQQSSHTHIQYLSTPVNALDVPHELLGFRTLFSSFHHLNPAQAQAVLQNAVDAKSGIAVFESTQRHPISILYMLLTPLIVMFHTPFIRPFTWGRLFWTYIIPCIPFIIAFDGIVSCLRTYTTDELKVMTQAIHNSDYHWEIGIEKIGRLPIGITYLIGFPKK